MVICTGHTKLEVGKVYKSLADDLGIWHHGQPFLVVRDATRLEFIQECIEARIPTGRYLEMISIPGVLYCEITLD